MKRLLFSLLFFIAATSVYPWLAFVVVIWGCFSVRSFLWEFIIIALVFDIMWGFYMFGFLNLPTFTIIVIGLMLIIKIVKNRIQIHA